MSAAMMTVKVSDIQQVAPAIKEFTLTPVDSEFFAFSPGSHVVVEMPGKDKVFRNAYSLLSDPLETASYKIAVRLQDQSRGGSVFMHQSVKAGDELKITPPANLFAPEWQAKKHLLIAGGVGITPFMSYLNELKRRDAVFELLYLYRSEQTGAYVTELQASLGEALTAVDTSSTARADLEAMLATQPLGTHIYICGPESLIEGVIETAEKMGWPNSHIHYEAFAAPKPGSPFKVDLQQSKKTIMVKGDESLLEALEANDIEVPNLCRGGVCGQCRTKVVEGEMDHHDEFLSEGEKADFIMPCVSRCKSDYLVLDI